VDFAYVEGSKVSTLGLATYVIIMLSERFYKEWDVAVMPVWYGKLVCGQFSSQIKQAENMFAGLNFLAFC